MVLPTSPIHSLVFPAIQKFAFKVQFRIQPEQPSGNNKYYFFPGSVRIWFGWSNPRSLDGFFSCLMRYRSTKLQCDDKSCPLPLIKTKLFPFLHPCHFPSSRPITVFTLGTGTTVYFCSRIKQHSYPIQRTRLWCNLNYKIKHDFKHDDKNTHNASE